MAAETTHILYESSSVEGTHTHTLTEGVMMSVWDDHLAAFGDTTETSNSMKDLKEGVTWLLTERYDINTLVM